MFQLISAPEGDVINADHFDDCGAFYKTQSVAKTLYLKISAYHPKIPLRVRVVVMGKTLGHVLQNKVRKTLRGPKP